GVGGGAARILPLHHVSHNFRAEPEKPRAPDKTGIVAAGDVDHWWRGVPSDHGFGIGCDRYSTRVRRAADLLCLCFVLRGERLPASIAGAWQSASGNRGR